MAQVLRAAGGSFNEELRELQLLSGVLLWLLCGRWTQRLLVTHSERHSVILNTV